MATLQLDGIRVVKGGRTVLDDVSIDVAAGELVALVGGSGSGKTSVLRVTAGLDRPDGGEVRIGGSTVTDRAPADRNVAMVFQSGVMYPFATVEKNVSFPLEIQKRPRDEIDIRVHAEGRALHIEELFDRRPEQLSAGYQQLVQVARAMVRVPSVFLMDEPLASLDRTARLRMRSELRTVQEGYGVTTLYATNDPTEAMVLADRIAVIDDGRIVQIDHPDTVYRTPVTRSVAELMGDISFLDLAVEADADGFWLVTGGLRIRAWRPALADKVGRTVVVGVRPEDVNVGISGGVAVEVRRVVPHGSHDVAIAAFEGGEIPIRVGTGSHKPGDVIVAGLDSALLFDSMTGVFIGRIGG